MWHKDLRFTWGLKSKRIFNSSRTPVMNSFSILEESIKSWLPLGSVSDSSWSDEVSDRLVIGAEPCREISMSKRPYNQSTDNIQIYSDVHRDGIIKGLHFGNRLILPKISFNLYLQQLALYFWTMFFTHPNMREEVRFLLNPPYLLTSNKSLKYAIGVKLLTSPPSNFTNVHKDCNFL